MRICAGHAGIAIRGASRHNTGMSDPEYTPLTPLEAVVRDGMAGIGNEHDIVAALMSAQVCVPSASEVSAAGDNLTPLIVQSQRYAGPMIVIFDDTRHIGPQVARMAPYCLQVDAEWLVRSIAPDHGLMLFVGPTMGCEISAGQVAEKRAAPAAR